MSSIIRKVITSPHIPVPRAPYSPAVQIGDTLYISGIVGFDPKTNKFAGPDAVTQAEQILKNLGNILEAAGVSYKNVLKSTILLADIGEFAKVNEVYAKYFQLPYPTRTTFQVAALPFEARIEMDFIATTAKIQDE
jgi:2-iminobutanoate/2-iminopropanoate deaminase